MSDSQLPPIAFDIETSGFGDDTVVTVAGFGHYLGESLVFNIAGRDDIDQELLVGTLDEYPSVAVQLDIAATERELLNTVALFATEQLDGDRHCLTAFKTRRGTVGSIFRSVAHGFSSTICRGRSATLFTQI